MFNHLLNHHTPVEKNLERATGERIEGLPLLIRALHNPDTCPAELLPWLAWSLSVDTWSPNWSEQQKRAACQSSLHIHRHKGTVGAVQDALATLGVSTTVVEPKDQDPRIKVPHKIQIIAEVNRRFLDAESANRSLLADIKRLITHTAPARCSFIFDLSYDWLQVSQWIVTSTPALKTYSTDATTERVDTVSNEGEQHSSVTIAPSPALNLNSNAATTEQLDTVRNQGSTASPPVATTTPATVFHSCIAETRL